MRESVERTKKRTRSFHIPFGDFLYFLPDNARGLYEMRERMMCDQGCVCSGSQPISDLENVLLKELFELVAEVGVD